MPATLSYPLSYKSDLFVLTVQHRDKDTKITMRVLIKMMNTESLPDTFPLLKKYLPSVLKSTCFNDSNFPFYEEVKSTELGHLFEHMLLEHLCMVKSRHGISNVCHSGLTTWDWRKDREGIFHITIDAGYSDRVHIAQALQISIPLMIRIMKNRPETTSSPKISPRYTALTQ